MEREELLQGIIDDIKSARHGENRAWIFDENANVSKDVYVFDTIKLLEEFKYNTDIIVNEVPFNVEDVRKEAEEAQKMLEGITTVGKLIDFINKDNKGLIDFDSIVVEWEGEYLDLDSVELELEEMPEDTKVIKVGFDDYGEYIDHPAITRGELNGALFKDDTFEFGVFDDDGDIVLNSTELDSLEGDLEQAYVISPDEIYEMGKSDNTYNYNCNISNDIDWCEADTDAYGKIAMMKFHIAGDICGNYTDEIFLKLGKYGSLMEYLYEKYDDVIREYKPITVDGKEYSVEIDAFREDVEVEIYDEGWDSISCYTNEKEDIIAKIREEFEPMQSIGNEDVSKDKKTDKGKDNR